VVHKTELPHLDEGGADQPELQLYCNLASDGANNNRSDHLAQTGNELSQVPIAICPVGRRNQIPLTSQPSGETTSELPFVTDGPSDQGKQEQTNKHKTKKASIRIPPKLFDKRGSTLPHTAQNTTFFKKINK
jgi:hypothetical protein